ncbi:MAG: hypothetical protein HZC54_22145 [Verrucomicrobia bacterium]|nr:hypothetical protein [Verrucomicrobiota bacterium]
MRMWLGIWLTAAAMAAQVCAASAARAAEPWTQAELRRFARDLGEYVTAHHIRRDPKSPQDGMVHKWYRPRDGRWVLDTRRNMLGDGAWFADALCLYYRATREPWALGVLRKHPLPFYQRVLLGSDQLFGVSKGICPLWWGDGAAVTRDGGVVKDFPKPPRMTSNALALDLATMLMSAGLLCPDAEAGGAAACLLRGDRACYDDPTVPLALGVAVAMLANDEMLQTRCLPLIPWQSYDGPGGALAGALCHNRTNSVSAALEETMLNYRMHVLAQPSQPLGADFAKSFIAAVFTSLRLADLWHDNGPRQPGLTPFDDAALTVGEKLAFYRSDKPALSPGSRHGPMLLCGAAIALQLMEAFSAAWESWYREHHAADARVSGRFADLPVLAKSGLVEMAWTTSSLLVRARGPLKLLLASATPGDDASATVTLDAAGRATAVSGRGEALRIVAAPQPDGRVELELPFTMAKLQKRWLNAVEDSRWIARLDDGKPSGLLFLSRPETVRARLALELSDGLRFWQKVFNDKGHVPAGISIGKSPAGADAELSDAAGYAFLIAAIAEYTVWLNGERDWDLALKVQAKP